jgi:CRP/FNR family cyclic AMP-dependent transcriptional regulator
VSNDAVPPARLAGLGAMLTQAQWNELLAAGAVRRFPPDVTLMREGDIGRVLHVLHRGRVKVGLSGLDGFGMPLAVRGPGEVLGEISVLGGIPRTATIVTIDSCDVRIVPAARFHTFVARHTLQPLISRFAGERLRESERFRAEYVALPFSRRLCRTLVQHAEPAGDPERDPWVVRLRMTQEQLGRMAGGCRASTSAVLRTLREEGVIRTAPRVVTVLNMPLLRRYAEGDPLPPAT